MEDQQDVTQLLVAWGNGDEGALNKLFPLIEKELQSIARRRMRRENPGHTLETDALINEAYLRLVDQTRVKWKSRAHFLAIAAMMMRRVLVDHAHARQAERRGGDQQRVTMSKVAVVSPDNFEEVLALDEALNRLSEFAPRQVKVVVLRYFGGLTEEETAEALDIHVNTVRNNWKAAKAWLESQLAGENAGKS
jgi:RNA polymerase sigma factor (TIGR02999 family)